MRSIITYFVWDNVSEMVLTSFVAVNNTVALRAFKSMIDKSQLNPVDVSLYSLGGVPLPDTSTDLSALLLVDEPVCHLVNVED